MKPIANPVIDYHFIPYEQEIRYWNDEQYQIDHTYIPFMFITAVRMGPIFIRKEWWFDKLLPHLTNLDSTMGTFKEDWFDIELSLHTWALGGYVGLYDAEGFMYDRDEFELGLNRNKKIDINWKQWENNHILAQPHLNWNVWNVSHLVELNEKNLQKEKNRNEPIDFAKLRLRTSMKSSSDNPAHPVGIENARQILLTLREFEQTFDINIQLKKEHDENLLRLHKKHEANPNNALNDY